MDDNTSRSSIQFVCSKCHRQLKVSAASAGSAAKCPACGSIETVPHSSGPSAATAPTKSDASPPQSVAVPPPANQLGAPVVGSEPNSFVPATPVGDGIPTQASNVPPARQSETIQKPIVASVPKLSLRSDTSAERGEITATRQLFDRMVEEIGKIYVGQDELVLGTLVALFSSGHVLIESVPGLGKTLFVRTLGKVLGCQFGRIQFTADLMPSDITGAPIFDMKNQEFRFRPGPVFTQLLLADEINRSPAKTHAALLETMQEYRVTVDGVSHELQRPFIVLATQNPIESEGTYNLPEAQLDRFMFKLIADYPDETEEASILRLHSQQVDVAQRLETDVQCVTSPTEILDITRQNSNIRVDEKLINYINQIVRLTRNWPHFYMGASPRAGIALMQGARTLAAFYGRDYAVPDDVVQIARPALRHRVIMTAEADVEGMKVDDVLFDLVRSVEVPRI